MKQNFNKLEELIANEAAGIADNPVSIRTRFTVCETTAQKPILPKRMDSKTDERLSHVRFFVEANSFERAQLWKEWSKEYYNSFIKKGRKGTNETNLKDRVSWKEMSGFGLYIDYITVTSSEDKIYDEKEMPLVVSFSFAYINGVYIGFYYISSMLTHSGIVNNFLRVNYPITYNDNNRAAYTDAQNFHNCIHFCKEEWNKRIKLSKRNNQ